MSLFDELDVADMALIQGLVVYTGLMMQAIEEYDLEKFRQYMDFLPCVYQMQTPWPRFAQKDLMMSRAEEKLPIVVTIDDGQF